MTIEVGLTSQGLEQVGELLAEIPRTDRKGAIAGALTAAALEVQTNVQADAPVSQPSPHKPRPGGYKRGIKVREVKYERREASIRVDATARHSHLLEYGTALRRPKRARVMTPNPGIGGPYFGRLAKALPARLIFQRAVFRTNIDAAFVAGLNRQLETATAPRALEDRSVGR